MLYMKCLDSEMYIYEMRYMKCLDSEMYIYEMFYEMYMKCTVSNTNFDVWTLMPIKRIKTALYVFVYSMIYVFISLSVQLNR